MTKNTEQLPLWTTSRQEVIEAFDADHTTSDAGVVLLNRIDAKLNLASRLAGAIHDRCDLLFVTHTMGTLLRQRLFQIIMGWQDCDDADTLRFDPFYKLACGRQPVSGDDLASQPTLSRLENSIDDTDTDRMRDVLLDVYLSRYGNKRKPIILDVDVTDAETHGRQQMSFFNSYYGRTCLTPLLMFDGKTGDLISATLRPATPAPATNCSTNRMSCTKATANHFRLLMHAAAYQMMLTLRELVAGTEAETWQFDTLRLRLLKVGGWVRQTVRRITLHLASSHPHRDLWALLTQRLSPA